MSNLENVKVVCGTGHRPADLESSYGYDFHSNSWKHIISTTKKVLLDLNPKYVISGMALGYDQALAISVLQLQNEGYNIKLIAAIPCKDQEKNWTKDSQTLYKAILDRCYKVKYVSNKSYTSDCMMNRNKFMVDNSQVVIAMFTGKPGGTANTVNYAKSKDVKIINILDNTPISTSTELKIGCLKNKGDNKMKVNLSKLELGTSRKNSMLPVSELNRKDYLDNPEILNKYFRVNNHDIDTCYVSEEISIDEVRADFHNKKLYKDGNMLKSKTAEYYTGNKFYLNLDADDDSFRNGDDDSRKLSGYDVYVAQEVRSSTVDKDLFEELYRFCIKTIKRRLVMLLDTEKVINELINIINYTDGFSNNCTAIQSSALVNSKKNLLKKISNRSVKDFIKSNNDYTVFGTDELTRNDYIETYQRVLRKLTDIRDSNLDFIRDIISNKEDSLENEILENNLELETISLSNSENSLELNY